MNPSQRIETMHRRNFIKTAAGAACFSALGSTALWAGEKAGDKPASDTEDELIRELIRANDQQVQEYLQRLERRSAHRWLGGIPNEHGIYSPHDGARFISVLSCAVASPESAHFRSPELIEPLLLAVRFLRTAQHEDGTIDLYSTNFRSPPDSVLRLATTAVCGDLKTSLIVQETDFVSG